VSQIRKSLFRILVLASFVASRPISAAESSPEYKFKAAFLYHFTLFVEWPSNVFVEAKSPLVIAILGENPFGIELDQGLRDKVVNGHPIRIRMVQSAAEARTNCHLLFISSSEKKNQAQIFQELQGASVLTVGETEDFTQAGGMIKFLQIEKRIRFQINDEAAKKSGLMIRAKLMELAVPGNR
jgi:hypothetical protein